MQNYISFDLPLNRYGFLRGILFYLKGISIALGVSLIISLVAFLVTFLGVKILEFFIWLPLWGKLLVGFLVVSPCLGSIAPELEKQETGSTGSAGPRVNELTNQGETTEKIIQTEDIEIDR